MLLINEVFITAAILNIQRDANEMHEKFLRCIKYLILAYNHTISCINDPLML